MAGAHSEVKSLPKRRDLRLARQAAEKAAQQAQLGEDLNVTAVLTKLDETTAQSTASINVTNNSATETTTTVREAAKASQAPRFAAMRKRIAPAAATLKLHLRGGMENGKRGLIGVGAGVIAAVALVIVVSFSNISQVQAVAEHSVLSSSVVQANQAATPDSLIASESTQAQEWAAQKAQTAQEIASSQEALCRGFANGATTAASAYVPEDQSMVYWPLQSGTFRVVSPFGYRTHPITGEYKMHNGVDLVSHRGASIYAVADGVVLSTTYGGSNNGIVIEHRVNGRVFTTYYLHSYANEIFVHKGQEVKAGEKIALVGSAGMSTGDHLHFETHPGAGENTKPVEPMSFMENIGAMGVGENCAQ